MAGTFIEASNLCEYHFLKEKKKPAIIVNGIKKYDLTTATKY